MCRHCVAYLCLLLGRKGCCLFHRRVIQPSVSENKRRQMSKGQVLYAGNYLGVTEMIVKKNLLKLRLTPPYGTITSVIAVIECLDCNPRRSSVLCSCSKREKTFSGIHAHFIHSGQRTVCSWTERSLLLFDAERREGISNCKTLVTFPFRYACTSEYGESRLAAFQLYSVCFL